MLEMEFFLLIKSSLTSLVLFVQALVRQCFRVTSYSGRPESLSQCIQITVQININGTDDNQQKFELV